MKVGIIGAGYISTMHAAAYKNLGVEIAAVSDINKASFLGRQEHYSMARYYRTHQELLADSSIDAVSICTNSKFHYEIAVDAIHAEKHIFCEKTMTESEEKSADIVKKLKAYTKNFQVGYMKRFFPATMKVQALLSEIGTVFSVHARSYQGYDHPENDFYNDPNWRPGDMAESLIRRNMSGGMLNMAGSHIIDLICLMVGVPMTAYSINWMPMGYDVEVSSNTLFTLRNGGVVHLDATLSPYSRAGIRQDGWDEKIEINGEYGRIEVFYVIWDKPQFNAPLVRFYSERTKAWTEYTFPKVNPFEVQIETFIDNCKNQIPSSPGAIDGYNVDCAIAACYKSAESGEPAALKELTF